MGANRVRVEEASIVTAWNYADIWESIAAAVPDRPAQIQGERLLTWLQFDLRASALATAPLPAGLGRPGKVAAHPVHAPVDPQTHYAPLQARPRPAHAPHRDA